MGLYEQDGLGSITSLSGLTGVIANSYAYSSFGNLTTSTGTLTNPFQYTGRDSDPETGLVYYRARYYDPAIGRFLSEDPIGFRGGNNFYAYVENDPLNFVDPLGTQSGMAQAQLLAGLLNGKTKSPCGPDCMKDFLRDLEKALGKPGCFVKCAVQWGPLDDIAIGSASLLIRGVRNFLATATGKTVIKVAGWCGVAATTIYCSFHCDIIPGIPTLPGGLTPFRIHSWANR